MGRISQFLEYAGRAKNKAVLSVANYIYKLKERGYSDLDILHKIYNNYGFAIETGRRGLQLVGANPYPHEHSARIVSPREMRKDKFRRQNNKFGRGVHAIWGMLKKDRDQTVILQAIRFDSSKFSAEQAKQWLRDHDMVMAEITFEPTKKMQKNPKHRVLPKMGDILKIRGKYLMVTWYGAGQYELRPTNSTGSYVYMLRNQLMNTRYKIVDRG